MFFVAGIRLLFLVDSLVVQVCFSYPGGGCLFRRFSPIQQLVPHALYKHYGIGGKSYKTPAHSDKSFGYTGQSDCSLVIFNLRTKLFLKRSRVMLRSRLRGKGRYPENHELPEFHFYAVCTLFCTLY